MGTQTQLEFSSICEAKRTMRYDSIAPLYLRSKPDTFDEHLAFAVGCSKQDFQGPEFNGCIHKLEVDAEPDFKSARLRVTHEVQPLQGNCDEITVVNDKLRLACFTNGAILSIKNFGYKKTFNCDVRGRQCNFEASIRATAVSADKSKFAATTTQGELAMYNIDGDEVHLLQRGRLSMDKITGLSFLNPSRGVWAHPEDETIMDGDNMLVFCTDKGKVGLFDARCGGEVIRQKYDVKHFTAGDPPKSPTCMCLVKNSTINTVYLGTFHGELLKIDLRNNKDFVYQKKFQPEGYIKRIREVVVYNEHSQPKSFVAFANESEKIRILDHETGLPDNNWKLDRDPGEVIQDFCQIGNRLVTCGVNTSIGCWQWGESRGSDSQVESVIQTGNNHDTKSGIHCQLPQ